MSKNTQVAEEFLEDEVAEEEEKKVSSHGFIKFLSILLLAGLVAGFFAPVYFSFADGNFNVYVNGSILGGNGNSLFQMMLTGIQDFMKGSEKTFPLFARLVWTNKYLYGVAVAGVLLLITTIITLATKNASPVWFRIDCIILMLVFAFYGGDILAEGVLTFDIVMIAGALAIVFMIIHAFSKGGKGVAPAFSFILLAAALVLTALYSFVGSEVPFCSDAVGYFFAILRDVMRLAVGNITEITVPATETFELVAYISFALLVVNLLFTALQMGFIKSNAFTVIRYIAQVGVSVAAVIMIAMNVESDDMIKLLGPSIAVAACAFVAFIFTCIAIAAGKPRTADEEEEEEEEGTEDTAAMDAAAQPAAAQPAPAPAPQPYVQQQPYAQPAAYPYYQPAPNVYININPATGAVTTSQPTAAPSVPAPEASKPVPQVQPAQAMPVVITAPVKEQTPAVAAAPVAEEPAEEEVKPAKKRSFFVFLSLVLALVSVGLFVYHYLDIIKGFFTDFSVETLQNVEFLLPCGFALGVLLGFICSLVALGKPSKGGAFFAFLFYALGGAACFANIELHHGGIVKNFTPDTDMFAIAVMVLIALAVLCAFIGIFRTRGVKKEAVAEEEIPAEEEEAAAPAAAAQPAPAPAPAPAPVAQQAKPVAVNQALVEEPETVEQAAAPATIPAPEEDVEEDTVEEQTDAFLRTLSPADKREFKRVFLQGKAPAYMPAYEVGGNNSRFFDAAFVYLGKIRSAISDNLLGAMYDFMMANK